MRKGDRERPMDRKWRARKWTTVDGGRRTRTRTRAKKRTKSRTKRRMDNEEDEGEMGGGRCGSGRRERRSEGVVCWCVLARTRTWTMAKDSAEEEARGGRRRRSGRMIAKEKPLERNDEVE